MNVSGIAQMPNMRVWKGVCGCFRWKLVRNIFSCLQCFGKGSAIARHKWIFNFEHQTEKISLKWCCLYTLCRRTILTRKEVCSYWKFFTAESWSQCIVFLLLSHIYSSESQSNCTACLRKSKDLRFKSLEKQRVLGNVR